MAAACRVEKLKLLSKLESAGVLSALENSGITLAYIEENKLLSKAEDLQLIKLVTDRCERRWQATWPPSLMHPAVRPFLCSDARQSPLEIAEITCLINPMKCHLR